MYLQTTCGEMAPDMEVALKYQIIAVRGDLGASEIHLNYRHNDDRITWQQREVHG
jgi:hypothetical protein